MAPDSARSQGRAPAGVYVEEADGSPRFVPAPPPIRADLFVLGVLYLGTKGD